MPVGLTDLLQERLDCLVAAQRGQQRGCGLASTQQRRDDDLVEVLAGQFGAHPLRLHLAALGERRVDDVEAFANPLGLAVADEDEFHGTDDRRGVTATRHGRTGPRR